MLKDCPVPVPIRSASPKSDVDLIVSISDRSSRSTVGVVLGVVRDGRVVRPNHKGLEPSSNLTGTSGSFSGNEKEGLPKDERIGKPPIF